jgi:hypothetical protein
MELPCENAPEHQANDETAIAERILHKLNSPAPVDQKFEADLRVLLAKVRIGDAQGILNACLNVVTHVGLVENKAVVDRVKSHFGRKGYVEKIYSWGWSVIWIRPAGDPLLIVAHAWMALGFSIEEFLRIYDAKESLTNISQELNAVASRVRISQFYVASLPKGNPTKKKSAPARPGVTMTPPQIKFKRTPGSMRQTFPQRYPGRFLEGGAPGLGKRA